MWVIFLKNLMTSIWDMLKNPTVVVGLIGVLVSGWLYITTITLNHKINTLQETIIGKDKDIQISKNNEVSCIGVNDKLASSQNVLKISIKALQQQVKNEQDNTEKWKKICQGKPTDVGQVPAKPLQDKGVIVDDNSNKKYIDYINGILNPK